jgi:hypothetical protein
MMVIDLDEVYAGELGRAEASCWSPSSEPEHGDSYSTAAITQKSLGPFELDELDAMVELAPGAAADLDLARVVAKALADEVDEPSISALAAELDRFEGTAEDRAVVLARELLPLGGRVASAIAGVRPEVVAALREATPALKALSKAERVAEKSEVLADDPAASSTLQPTGCGEPPRLLAVVLEKRIPLLKTDEERYVLGVVLEPEIVDAQDDIYSAAEIRNAAHSFMEQYQNIGLMHRGLVNGRVKILESYLAPTSFALDGAQVRKGTWLLAVRVLDDDLWAQIKSGELTGLSMGGSARRE